MDAKQTSDMLISLVKKTNLNFSISESPFSALISIRKSFNKSRAGDPIPSSQSLDNFLVNENLQAEYNSVLETLAVSESEREAYASANHQLSIKLEKAKVEISRFLKDENEAKKEIHGLKEELLEMKTVNKTLKCDATSAFQTIKKGEHEIKELQRKNKILSKNLKKVASEKKKVIKDVEKNVRQLGLETSKKIKIFSTNTPCPSMSIIPTNNSHCSTLNTSPTNSNSTPVMQSTKTIPGNPMVTTKNMLQQPELNNNQGYSTSHSRFLSSHTDLNSSCKSKTKSSQTEHSQEIPYRVTDLLPPIFNSQLCFQSRRILYLSRSLPNLSTVNWVMTTEDDILQEQAEQALSDQYDRQVTEYYEEAREKASAVRQVFDENLIEKLFEET